jgi:hypothetical protein
MTTDWYAPNQQAVRADGSGPAEEGTGGGEPPDATDESKSKKQDTQPHDEPQVDPARASWSKTPDKPKSPKR